MNETSGDLYLSRALTDHLDVYGPWVTAADATTLPANERGGVKATLHGTISAAGGPSATCQFQYLPEATYLSQKQAAEAAHESSFEVADSAFAGAETAPCEPPGPFEGAAVEPVKAEVTGLAPETRYEFRLLGTNSNGSLGAAPLSLETFGKPVITETEATARSTTEASLTGKVNPRGLDTEVTAQYVTRARFEASGFAEATTLEAPAVPAEVTGSGDLSAATGTGNLSNGSTAVTGLITSTGAFQAGQRIEGTGIPPNTTIVEVKAGELVLSQAATANGTGVTLTAGSTTVANLVTEAGTFAAGQSVEAAGIPSNTTIVSVEGTTLTLSKPATEAGTAVPLTAAGPQPLSLELTGLEPATEYRARFLAANEASEGSPTAGEAVAFTTYAELPRPATQLPDDRAWELVSPADKHGGEPFALDPNHGSGAQCGAAENGCKPGVNIPSAPSLADARRGSARLPGLPLRGDRRRADRQPVPLPPHPERLADHRPLPRGDVGLLRGLRSLPRRGPFLPEASLAHRLRALRIPEPLRPAHRRPALPRAADRRRTAEPRSRRLHGQLRRRLRRPLPPLLRSQRRAHRTHRLRPGGHRPRDEQAEPLRIPRRPPRPGQRAAGQRGLRPGGASSARPGRARRPPPRDLRRRAGGLLLRRSRAALRADRR